MRCLKVNNKGFTLVEVLVVVVILVVLAGILIPTFSKFINDKNFSENVEEEADDVLKSAQAAFYDLYAEGSHGDTYDCIISGENQTDKNDPKKFPTTYRIETDNPSKDCDIHWNPIAADILSSVGLNIRDNYPNCVFVCTGRYDIYADPLNEKVKDYYDPIKAYTVYAVGYQPIWWQPGNNKNHLWYIFKDLKGNKSKVRDDIINKSDPNKKDSPVPPLLPKSKQSYIVVDGEVIWVQYYLLKGDKNNNIWIKDIWKSVGDSK